MKRVILIGVLLGVGLMQMVGDLTGLGALKGIGAASGMSPAPKVFSAVQGLETYSSRFWVEWTDKQGQPHGVQLTPEIYSRMCGPYNRRNVYGAVVAYGPVLASNKITRAMYGSVARYALCGPPPLPPGAGDPSLHSGPRLLAELGIDVTDRVGPIRIRVEPVAGSQIGDLPLVLEAPCP